MSENIFGASILEKIRCAAPCRWQVVRNPFLGTRLYVFAGQQYKAKEDALQAKAELDGSVASRRSTLAPWALFDSACRGSAKAAPRRLDVLDVRLFSRVLWSRWKALGGGGVRWGVGVEPRLAVHRCSSVRNARATQLPMLFVFPVHEHEHDTPVA